MMCSNGLHKRRNIFYFFWESTTMSIFLFELLLSTWCTLDCLVQKQARMNYLCIPYFLKPSPSIYFFLSDVINKGRDNFVSFFLFRESMNISFFVLTASVDFNNYTNNCFLSIAILMNLFYVLFIFMIWISP